MHIQHMLIVTSLVVAVAACGGDDSEKSGGGAQAGNSAAGSAAGSGGEQAGNAAAGSAADGGDTIPDLNGCTTALYQDQTDDAASRTIAIAAMGLTFTPKCMTIAVGQTVRWAGSLTAHPLAAGNADDPKAGSADSPIKSSSTGTSVEFSFPAAGTYPYYCTLHGYGAGLGMSGAVHVR